MRSLFTLFAIHALACLPAIAQTKQVLKTISTNGITESLVVPSGKTLTIASGATLTAASGSTITGIGSGSGLTIGSSTITSGTSGRALYNNSGVLGELDLASTYAPIASPTFTGTVTIPSGASISGYLTTATAASTYAPISHNQAWSTITSTPTTLAGYGITDAITAATAASTYAPLASPTFTGTVTNGRVSMTSGAVTITNQLFPTRTVAIGESGIGWGNVGGSGFSVSLNPSTPTADRIVQFDPNGAIVSTADTGTVTNAMLAGSIAISKIAATGSANNTTYLRGDGSWATPSGGGGGSGGNWVLISTTTISGSPSTLDFTFSGSYRRYRLELENVTQSSPFSYILRMQTSTNGGSTFDSSPGTYGYCYGPIGSYGAMSTTATYMQLLPDTIIGLSGVGVWGEIDFYDPLNASTRTFAKWNLFGRYWSSVSTNYVLGSGVRDSAADVDAVRLFWSTGTFAGGKIRLFGWSE